MAIDRSKLQRMYKLMADNGYSQDYNTFEKKFTGNSNYANRKAVYDLFTKNGADLGGSYEEFMRKLQKPRATKPQQQPKTALGRAQQSVAQQKWGGGVVTHGNTTAYESASAPMENDSELVRGLKNANAVQRLQAPVSYTKPGAVEQMVKQTRERQHVVGQNVEQAGREFTNRERDRRNAPAFDLGNEEVNNNLVKTRGQLEKEMEESAAPIADKNFADTFANMIAGERQAAEKRGFDAYLQRTMFSATPMGSTLLGTIAYNAERDPAKLQQNLLNSLGENMESMLSDPNVAQKVVTESKRLGVDPEDYVKTALMPSIQNKLMAEYDKTELKEWMPRNAFVDIIDGLGDGFQVGSILDAALTKAQRQYRQRAIMATQNGENPYYQRDKYGVTEGVRSALSLASDVVGPGGGVLGGIGKGVGAASAKVFGNEVKTIARMANMSKLQRMFKPSVLMRGAAETGANFGIYEGLKGAQNYASTTDDVKVGEMLKESVVSAAHGAVSGATLGVVGKMLGGLGYNVGIKGPSGVDPNFGKNMLKGLGMKGVQIIGEGTAFYAGGNFNNALSGADTDWSAGNLLSNIMAAGIYKIVSTHTATGAANMLTPKKGQSYGGSVAVKFGTALYKAAMAPSAQGKAFAFTPDEKQQLFASGDKAGLQGKEGYIGHQDILTWAERVSKATPVGKEDKSRNVQMVREYYESVMHDPNVSWDAKMKLNALLGIAPATRPEMDMRTYTVEDGKRYVNEYAKDGTLLSKRSYKNMEQLEAIEYDLVMQKENQRMLNGLGYILNRDCSRMDLQIEFLRQHDYDFDNPDSPRNQAIMDDMLGNNKTLTLKRGRTLHDEWLDFVSKNGITTKLIKDIADAHGLSVEEMFKIVNKEPIKRTEEEQKACVALRKALNNTVYEDGMPHADQADSDGKDVVEENGLGTENPNNEAVAEVLNNMNNAEKAFNAALESNDVLKQEYERLAKEGLSEPQIYMELINSGLTQEQLVPFADYINTKAKAVGMYRGTEQKIAETVQKHVEQWSYKGELNGEKQEGGQMLFVKDNNGRLLIVGAGDVAFDSEGRARENVGDMLSVLDPNTKEMDFVSKKDVQLDHVEKTEDYAKNYQEMLEVMNSVAYAESEKVKEKSEKSDTKTESVVTPKEGASAPGVEDVKPIGEGEKKNPSDNGNGSNETLTFADGSPVPMMKDTKGRETADYSQMTPEQGAEWMSSQFGENAEAAVDGQIMRAEKMLKEAEKIKVDYTGDLNDAKEAEAQKAKAVDAAKAELELYTNIKKVMTANKVKAGMEKVGSVGEEGSVSEAGNLGAVREKFESGKRIVGNKRTRTLADGSKLRGHYEIVEADSLTPSHNANDGYKKSEGFPVNEEGRTINDRDYENDKQAQLVTDMIAMKYDGQAVDQVPVVTSDGIVVDGNGRTMAGQKAAKNGTDSAYLEALKENAENYGFTAEQIEQSGIKHPRLVLVSDEPMKYDTATFAKFNKNEKKSQGNTQQAVANSKKLSADEIGTIISEIEGSGSLDAFFNNPTAINSLLKRLIDKGVIGLNEVAGLREGEDKLSAAGKDFVKNLLLGSVFSENTIRMMGADAMLKTKALNGIRAVLDNMKLGDYALRDEIDKAVQLVYEARQQGGDVDAYLRTPAMFGENAADRYDPISQAIALALEGKAEDFRELMMAYNRNAAPYADASQTEMFGEKPSKEEFKNEFLKLRNWKDYETRHSNKEGNGDAGSSEGTEPQARGGNEPTEGQREVDETQRTNTKEESEESDSKVEGVVTPKGDIKDATAPKGDKTKEEPSKTNPLAWLAHTAEMYKDEQVQKAKEELAKAKESGDASDIKRATTDMKQAMETKLRGNGIGLVERRRIIGREIGKILGEEAGKAEAEKIDKPWKDMDGEERMATAEKNPLTEEEIRNNTSEENKSLIDDAVDYVNGNHGIVQQIAYLKIYDDVRNRHEDAPDNSGAEDRTQLAATDNGGSKELGVGTGREGGGSSEQLGDGTSGEGRLEQLQHGSQNSTGQPDVPTGEGSHSQGEGEAPGLGGVPTGNTQRERGSNDGSNGATVRHERGRGSGDKTATTNGGRKPTAKQGTHFPDNGSLEQKKQNTAAKKAALKDALKNWAKLGRGELGMNLAGLNSRQIEYLPEVMKAVKDYGVALIDEGIYRVKDWIKSIREAIGEDMKGMKFSDKDIDGFIEEMWNSKYTMNGETHTIGEWADIYGQEKLRKELAGPLTDKAKRQIEVEDVPVKIGDKANIEETLPFLLPQQQEDVLRAETQFFGNEHADREHAYGKGYMFTNGTGTGKTYTGLGIAKRLVKQGKGRILIVTPSQKKVSDWIKDGHNLNMEIRDLDSWAKDRGTTATTESGEGVVITTFANFGVNKKLLETKWDAVIYDESHRIMENKKGAETARSMQHYMVTNRDENHCFLRLQEINKDYQKQKSLGEQFDIERAKETERIHKEYKASHPSATERDVAYATSRMVPRDVYNFTPSDYVTFPKLGKIHAEYVKALSHYTNEVKPKLEAQAKDEWKDTKTIFLSATPFNTRENLDYVEGYIFKYPEGEKAGRMSGRTQFYLDHFGAAYKYRYNRLEQSTSNPETVAKQEIAFSDYLQHTLGTMSGRIIDSPYDYSRDFPTVSPDHAERFNQAVQDAVGGHGVLADAYRKTIGDYTYGSALFETMKVANIIERIKAHLDAGRKVVIFHRRVETKEPLNPPFALMLDRANFSISLMNPGEEKNEAIQAVRAFRKKYADLLKWEQTLDYSMPREQIAKVFGKDNVLFFSGKESSKVKDKAVDTFNDDNSGKNIIVIQEASGKEGISLHDTTGKHQRVCITLALPQSPITALQIEGRTYRIGNKSNAIFEYPILGLNSEMMLFGQKFNNQVSTTENLALGSQARSLRDSFANGILEHSGVVPIDQQGVGGKEFDAPKEQNSDPYDDAVLDYYSNQKLNSRNREGVDYFPTPEPLGYKMMEWANMGEGDTVMEPSAGHGAIARYAPKGNQMVAIEPSQSLFAKLQLKAGGLGRKFVNTIFENYDISNKHDVVVMNPPFGKAGATAIAHLGKAFKHLEEGGRVVALIPRGSTDKKFDKWIEGEKTAVLRAEVELPDIVFKQAGTNVVCRVVVVDKISNEAMRAKAGRVEKVSLGGHYDKIEDFFEDLRDIEMPDRIIDTNTIMQKKSKQTAKDLKELKDVTVNLNEHGINVHVRGDRNDYSIMFDLGEYNAEQRKSILSGTYERFEEYERYTRDETSQAVIAELKKLTCKLTGMTEEEMQRYLKKQNDGKGVMYRMEHAAEVYGKANAHYRMELGDTFSDSKEHFDAVRDRAVEEKGIVMPNLNKEKVKVVEVEKHLFGENKADAIKNARTWAKDNLATKNGDMPTMRDGTPYIISKAAIDKYLSNSAISKSDDPFVHLSVLKKLTDVIHESIEAEIHADYKKGEDGMRSVENGYGEGVLVHRLYGAVEIDGKMYRVKTTMQEFRGGEENKPHSYEVTKIELLDSPGKRENPDRPPLVSSNNSIDTAKLLQGVEKSYDSGKKLLDESKDLTDGETFFRKEGNGVVTPEKTSGTSNAVNERIIKTVEKVAKQTGGKVKMVNSVEEIENPKVRKDIENGKQVTGWYDEKTGEVHLYMPNIHDTYTAEKTVWHETVGHKGMRGLLGDKFDSYMRDLWMDLDNPINAELRAYVKEKMNMNHLGFYDAIEEFIAKSAEDGKGEPGFWNYIKNKVTDALHEIGYRVSPNVKDVKYMLWLAKNVQKHGDSPLWKMRAEAVRWKIEHEKTSSVVEENGMMYDNNGKKHGLLDLNKKDFDEATDGHVHYRTSPMTASKIEEYNRRLSTKWYAFKESTVDDMQSLQEAMQIISGVKDAYTDIPSAFNPLQCHNRMGSMVMQMCERYDREYTEPLGDAFKKVVSAMPGKDGAEQTRNANLYFIKKHGLERNRVLFVRDWFRKMETTEGADAEGLDNLDKAWKGERSDLRRALDSGQIDLREYYRKMDEWIVQNLDKDFKAEEHDYSGMHGIYDVKKGEEYDDANVIDEVMSTESQLGADLVKSFWDAKKKATDFTIDQEYANGFMDKNGRDHLKEMFDWYVPLRKFDDTVAEDVYGYISGGDTKNDIGSVIEKARGRESLSDVNVLAQISALAKSSILNGGKNVERQHFMRFVEAYEKGDAKDRIFVEIQPWVEKHIVDGNEVWEEVMPNIPENSTQEQINDILNTFEETMKAKQANGEAKIARKKSDIGYKFERSSDMNQHIVNVYVNGRVRRFVCQGNPRAAQAINGMLRDSGTRGWVSEKSAELNRFCAQLNTSLNPDFISSNLMRDLTFASANLTKEGMGYTWDFCMEYAKNWASMARRKDGGFDGGYLGMFRRYKEGRLDANNQKERWFKEFMDNGGETGFVSLKKYEDIIKEYENLVKTGNKEGDRWLMKKLREGGALIELANEVVENVARYSTYCVSRKRGRSIGKSIYDAKEVSSNFNRHGSGDAIKSLKTEYDGKTNVAFRKSVGWFNSYMKNHTMFYNAGVQGANLFTKNLKHAPKTAAIAFGAMPFGLNIAVALLNQLLISQEDEKKRNGVKNPYAELPEWKRRNNLCIYWGGGKFKTIPMGIELRAFYGLGDIAAGYMVDERLKSDTPIGFDIIGQMAQLVPASDFLGHHSPSSGIKDLGEDVILSMTPTTMKPYLELGFNRDWTGRPIYRDNDYLDKAPRWKRAYDSTNDAYMTINKWANKTFNGIDSTNEDLKGSGMLADAVDFFTAPYGLQHIVEGYTGGAGATIGRTYQTGKSLVKGVVSGVKDDKGFAEGFNKEWDKVNPNTIPFYRVFNYTPKEGNDMQRTKSKWYNYADELEQLKYNMQQMKTNTPDTTKNIHNAAEKFKFSQNKDGRKLKIYEAADRYITAKRRILKKAKDKAVVDAVNEAINRKMQEAVEDLDRIE